MSVDGKQAHDQESDRPLLDLERGHTEQESQSCSLKPPSEFSLECIWAEVV